MPWLAHLPTCRAVRGQGSGSGAEDRGQSTRSLRCAVEGQGWGSSFAESRKNAKAKCLLELRCQRQGQPM